MISYKWAKFRFFFLVFIFTKKYSEITCKNIPYRIGKMSSTSSWWIPKVNDLDELADWAQLSSS